MIWTWKNNGRIPITTLPNTSTQKYFVAKPIHQRFPMDQTVNSFRASCFTEVIWKHGNLAETADPTFNPQSKVSCYLGFRQATNWLKTITNPAPSVPCTIPIAQASGFHSRLAIFKTPEPANINNATPKPATEADSLVTNGPANGFL